VLKIPAFGNTQTVACHKSSRFVAYAGSTKNFFDRDFLRFYLKVLFDLTKNFLTRKFKTFVASSFQYDKEFIAENIRTFVC
jgi:hypothetical protein